MCIFCFQMASNPMSASADLQHVGFRACGSYFVLCFRGFKLDGLLSKRNSHYCYIVLSMMMFLSSRDLDYDIALIIPLVHVLVMFGAINDEISLSGMCMQEPCLRPLKGLNWRARITCTHQTPAYRHHCPVVYLDLVFFGFC